MTSPRQHLRTWTAVVAGCLAASLAGCTADPPAADELPSIDEQVLIALDYYNPVYKLDADGRVTNIKLEGRHVLASALVELGKLNEVRAISLYGAQVTDDSLANLHGCTKLRNLGLGGTPISDKGLLHLEKLQDLQHIWVPKARVSTEAVNGLKNALPGLSVHFQ
ncbi:MAG: hypothetical protein L0Y71_05890 [Gemmataceae bacterium]|nr:hypothetical protein [Gemmataceae bacterium]